MSATGRDSSHVGHVGMQKVQRRKCRGGVAPYVAVHAVSPSRFKVYSLPVDVEASTQKVSIVRIPIEKTQDSRLHRCLSTTGNVQGDEVDWWML